MQKNHPSVPKDSKSKDQIYSRMDEFSRGSSETKTKVPVQPR